MKKIAFTPERRKFFRDTARTCGGLAGLGVLLGLQQHQSLARQGVALRPPSALADDKNFTAACIRCGQCVQACPYKMLHLASLLSSMEAGTPISLLVRKLVKCVRIFLVLRLARAVHWIINLMILVRRKWD